MEEITLTGAICSQCSSEIKSDSKFCTNCGFPENGDEKEKAVFHANKAMKKNQIMDDNKKVTSARKTLYWLAGIFMFFGLVQFFMTESLEVLLSNVILAVIFLLLAYWSQKRPFAAILSALLLYVTVIALNAIIEPYTLAKGIFVKIIILSFLIKGTYSASQISKINE